MRLVTNAFVVAIALSLTGCSKKMTKDEYEKESKKLNRRQEEFNKKYGDVNIYDDSVYRAKVIDLQKDWLKAQEEAAKRLKKGD
jgi:hypothetical protein